MSSFDQLSGNNLTLLLDFVESQKNLDLLSIQSMVSENFIQKFRKVFSHLPKLETLKLALDCSHFAGSHNWKTWDITALKTLELEFHGRVICRNAL